jgi:cyanate permease
VPTPHASCSSGRWSPFWFFAAQYLQTVAGYTPVQAGLAFLPITLVNFAVAMSAPRLTARFGNATLLAASLAVSVVGWRGWYISRHAPRTSRESRCR